MDPIVRTLLDWRLFAERVSNPFDREELERFITSVGEDLAFTVVRRYRRWAASAEVAWLDGNNLFLAANVEFGSNRERLGAVAELYALKPQIAVVMTSDTLLTKFQDLVAAVEQMHGPKTVLIDVKNRKHRIVGER